MSATIKTSNSDTIQEAASLLNAGSLVAFPTETVYGLGANALDGTAIAKIFEAKGRPSFNPLITHVNSLEDAQKYGVFNDLAKQLAQHFWPGAMTLIVPLRQNCGISELITAGLNTIALRIPAHKTARELIKLASIPIAAPSANKSGSLSPTAPIHVAQSLGDKVNLIIAGGSCDVGLESTVIDVTANTPEILRPGSITAEDIYSALEIKISEASSHEDNAQPKSPGLLLKHYAPDTPVRLNAVDVKDGEALLAFGSTKFMGVEGGGAAKDLPEDSLYNLSESGDLHEAASNLFSMLHLLDKPEHKAIAVMNIPDTGLGIAINDRLKRAAQR